jgi:hypothetical protein
VKITGKKGGESIDFFAKEKKTLHPGFPPKRKEVRKGNGLK